MPELPEVETIVRALRAGGRGGVSIVGKRVSAAQVFWPRTLAEPGLDDFQNRISGQQVVAVQRRGKFVVIPLERDTLLIHLRMSGDLRVESSIDARGDPLPLLPHDRAVIHFLDHQRLVFNNPRKFGRVWLVADPQTILHKLGPEPLEQEFTADVFYQLLRSHRRQIKALLLDQTFIAGLGNIYTDEALFQAKIHPRQISSELNPSRAEGLWRAIRAVLREGIQRNGASIDWAYRGGNFQNTFCVYQRTGKPCPECGYPIERGVIGQRGTHFCPHCQPLSSQK